MADPVEERSDYEKSSEIWLTWSLDWVEDQEVFFEQASLEELEGWLWESQEMLGKIKYHHKVRLKKRWGELVKEIRESNLAEET